MKEGNFINLIKNNESIAMTGPEQPEARGPSFYVHDIELPVEADDEIEATVKLKPSVTKTERNGKIDYSYDFEVRSIKFNS